MNLDDLSLDDLAHLIEWAWHGAGELGRRSWLLFPIVKKLYAVALARLRTRPVVISIPVLKANPKLYSPTLKVGGRFVGTGTLTVRATVLPATPRC